MFNPDVWKHELLVGSTNTTPHPPNEPIPDRSSGPRGETTTASSAETAPIISPRTSPAAVFPKAVSLAVEPTSMSVKSIDTVAKPTMNSGPSVSADESAQHVIPMRRHEPIGPSSPSFTSPPIEAVPPNRTAPAIDTTTDTSNDDSNDTQNPPILRIDERIPSSESAPSVEQASIPDTPAIRIVASLLKSSHLLRSFLSEHFAEFGLSDIRYTVMRRIDQAGEGGCSQAELARELNQSESSISTLIDRMRNDGLIYRLRSENDRRKRVLLLSAEGRQRFVRARACHGERMAQLVATLDDQQVQVLQVSLDLLTEQLSDARPTEAIRSAA